MSNHRDYYHSSSRTSRRDVDDRRREERLPSLHNVVGHAYGTASSVYPYQDDSRSLPPASQHPSYDTHDRSSRGPRLAPIHSDSPSEDGAYSSYSSSTRSSTRQYPHATGSAPRSSSLRSSADYPLDAGHSFQAFAQRGPHLVPVTSPSIRPQGTVRSCDIPDEHDDPRKRYKCSECGKGFDRPSSLETHSYRHSGDRPHACPASDCDKSFTVKSNMMRHYREQHGGEVDDDHRSTRQPIYSSVSRGSSEQSSSATFFSSSRRR